MGSVSLGDVISERAFSMFRPDGSEIQVAVRLGKPQKDTASGRYMCPLQVTGLGSDQIFSPWGDDPFVALHFAIDLIGQLLDAGVERQQLYVVKKDNGFLPDNSWIWRYHLGRRKAP
jgi:hypothetical protein